LGDSGVLPFWAWESFTACSVTCWGWWDILKCENIDESKVAKNYLTLGRDKRLSSAC